MPDKLSLFELIERENDPELRVVLEHYRAAVLSLEAAAQKLGRTGRRRWQMACVSRSRDVEWQAQRYMGIERAREHKLEDYREDLPTNPRGYPALKGLQLPAAKPPNYPPLPPLPARFNQPAIPRPPRVPNLPSIILESDNPEITNHHEPVFDTDPVPSKRWALSQATRSMMWRMTFELAVLVVLVWALWLFKHYGHRLD